VTNTITILASTFFLAVFGLVVVLVLHQIHEGSRYPRNPAPSHDRIQTLDFAYRLVWLLGPNILWAVVSKVLFTAGERMVSQFLVAVITVCVLAWTVSQGGRSQ
jgi:hypothetical protein